MQNKQRLLFAAAFLTLLGIVGFQWYQLERTPAELLVCNLLGQKCFVTARYRDLDDCNRANRLYHSAYCNSVSEPGKMTCELDKPGIYAKSFCTY
jgi:hypothetical protein